MAVWHWRVKGKRVMTGSFDMTSSGLSTTLEQDTCNEILNTSLVVLVTKHTTRAGKPGIENAWIGTPSGFESLKVPNISHKMSKGYVRSSCRVMQEWAEDVFAIPGGKMKRAVLYQAVMMVLSGSDPDFEPPRFGYGLAIRHNFLDASRLSEFDSVELASALAASLPSSVVVEDISALMGETDVDEIDDYGMPMPFHVLGAALNKGHSGMDDKLRILVRTPDNSDAFLIAQHCQYEMELQAIKARRLTSKPSVMCDFAAGWMAAKGKRVFWGYVRTPRDVKQVCRLVNDWFGDNDVGPTCAICLEGFRLNRLNEHTVLPCGHSFHKQCVYNMIQASGSDTKCAICSADATISLKGRHPKEVALRAMEFLS